MTRRPPRTLRPACRRCGHAPAPGRTYEVRPLPREQRADPVLHECVDPLACEQRQLVLEHFRLEREYRTAVGIGAHGWDWPGVNV